VATGNTDPFEIAEVTGRLLKAAYPLIQAGLADQEIGCA
jgi:hypothetical protein